MARATITPTGKPCWSREAAIGDYGGDLNKEPSKTEGSTPYAWFVYRERRAMRGSAFSQQIGGTLVHCENLATARLFAWVFFRKPEQFRNDCLPGTSDQGLEYWATVLAIPTRPSDERWQVRQRAEAHYKAVTAVNLSTIQTALQDLLGDAYVDATFNEGASLASPPTLTFWPGVNPGDSSYSLGGGTWASERSHLYVEVTQPAGMSDADFSQLINVQAFQLLDRMLPAFCTFSVSLGGGFHLDLDQLDFVGITPE
jgi:hypothetical protein